MKEVCVITGGTGGIGYHLALGFNEKGYKVYALDIECHKKLPKEITFMKVDLRNAKDIKEAFQQIKEESKAAHILINNGAVAHFNKSINDITVEEFNNVISINLSGSFICAKEFISVNKGESYGRIINISSTRWNQNEANWEAYGASKGGVVSLTNSLAISLSDTPITVNAISPGWIQVDNYDKLTEIDHLQHPSRRVGKPKDILNACLFLANKENDFINGHNLVVDGGMTKKMIYEE